MQLNQGEGIYQIHLNRLKDSGNETFSIQQLGKVMGKRWRELSPEEKKLYTDMAAEEQVCYQKEMDQYRKDTNHNKISYFHRKVRPILLAAIASIKQDLPQQQASLCLYHLLFSSASCRRTSPCNYRICP